MPDTPVSDLVRSLLLTVPDFPQPGILFRDLTPVLADGPALRAVVDDLVAAGGPVDAVAGVEARGFLLAAAAAYASGVGTLAVRKAGKLPGEVLRESYDLEYGDAAIELHPGQLPVGSRVLLLDDVLATGGTLEAAARLLERAGYEVAGIGVVLELEGLGGRARLAGRDVHAIIAL
ncbi:adenine phosphoribosyltransferase [Clavibacter sp. B3I6]|uniref:adenine phosphoribosyltransferase n=1 Tax=Clavibacter sp. B3I6 TaxID=3042268 RepID=UPI0027826AF4|nr:adenine phosphoribosyltransferase [Clavibacter sp. B3I6]MDQ0745702.1 adenine phosphoribosyltransferase [Clavibacter sp. B3I6]